MTDFVNPEREVFKAFAEMKSEAPIHMLNLIRLNETATYDDGALVTGQEAYAAYGRRSGPIFQRVGGRIVWSGKFDLTLIGPQDEAWDIAFIAEYPNSDAFIEMLKDEEYQLAVKHRNAAVKTSRLIRISPNEIGNTFG
jgi:uncharacterized protein (DUF1330 family)